jgi:hypothetical protein
VRNCLILYCAVYCSALIALKVLCLLHPSTRTTPFQILPNHPTVLSLPLSTTYRWRAYDTNEGIEVAWNVVKLSRTPPSERKRIKTEVKLLKVMPAPSMRCDTPLSISTAYLPAYISVYVFICERVGLLIRVMFWYYRVTN